MKKLITLILVAVLMISFAVVANAAVGTVVKANKVDSAPNMEEIDESWGEPAITVTSSSPNTQLFKYWNEFNDTAMYSHEGTGPNGRQTIEPEDNPFDLYVCWDNKYLYVGVLSPDYEICGSVEPWRGDGVMMWVQPLDTMVEAGKTHSGLYNYTDDLTDPETLAFKDGYSSMCEYYWTLDFDDYSVSNAGAAAECDKYILMEDDMMHATIAIPLTNLGLNPKKMDLHGFELGAIVLRTSSRSSFDEGYAGWLAWGKYHEYETCESVNTIVLVDPAKGDVTPSTEAPATEAPATEAPATEAPATEAPATEAPATEAPATEAPATEAPATEAPATEAPATEAPATEAPATEAPATEAPATEAPVVVPETPAEIVAAAYALEDGEALPYTSTLTGVINAINTEWSEQYGNITVTMTVEGKDMMCYRLQGDGAKDLAIGDTITVTGTIKNYKGTIEFDAKCNLDAVVKATPAETEAPATEAPVTEAPATEAPATEAPATEAPKVEEPVEKNNTGLIIAIVAVVVVVGAGLGIVLGKKKK